MHKLLPIFITLFLLIAGVFVYAQSGERPTPRINTGTDTSRFISTRPTPPPCCRPFRTEGDGNISSIVRNVPTVDENGEEIPQSLPPVNPKKEAERYRKSLEEFRKANEQLRKDKAISKEEYDASIALYKARLAQYKIEIKIIKNDL